MKLELSNFEVLALYEHLLESRFEKISDKNFDIHNVRERLREHILIMLSPQVEDKEYEAPHSQDEMFDVWEEKVAERLEEKRALETNPENKILDLLEEYEVAYPKGFKKSRGPKRRNKK